MKTIRNTVSLFALLLPMLSQAQFLQPSNNPPASIQLAWDASSSPDVGSYNVYYGVGSGQYTNKVTSVGTNLTVTITLLRGASYYFAATAVSTNGLESDFSNEINYRPANKPVPPFLRLAKINFAVMGVTEPYALVKVESTKDLHAWGLVGSATADGAGVFSVSDSSPVDPSPSRRFYRAYF